MLSDYAKAQKIRDRITKYATDHDRVALKYPSLYSGLKNILITIEVRIQQGPSMLVLTVWRNRLWVTIEKKTSFATVWNPTKD